MRKAIIILAVVTLLSVASAAASATGFWSHKGSTYDCIGFNTKVFCAGRNGYKVAIKAQSLIMYQGDKPIFGCRLDMGTDPALACARAS